MKLLNRCLAIVMGSCFLFGQLGMAVAQTTDYSGIWYVASHNSYNVDQPVNNHYMVPAQLPDWAQPGNPDPRTVYFDADMGYPEPFHCPYITTFRTNKDSNSRWDFIATNDGYYYIRHHDSQKYMVYQRVTESNVGDNRYGKVVHLEVLQEIGDNAKFAIGTTTGFGGSITIIPKSIENESYRYLNVHGGPSNLYYGSDAYNNYRMGLIGVYAVDQNSCWHLELASLPMPTISYSWESGQVSITTDVTDAFIYYTLDGTDPTTSSTPYNALMPFTLTEAATVKAIVVKSGVVSVNGNAVKTQKIVIH